MARTHFIATLGRIALATVSASITSGCQAESVYEDLASLPSTDSESDTTGLTGLTGVTAGGSAGDSASVTITAVTSDTGGGSSDTIGTDGLSDTDGTSDTDDTDGSDAGPPEILGVSISPQPIVANGLITAEVTATASDGVRLTLESGATINLEESAPGTFVGAFPIFTGLDNGPHIATVTPWLGVIEGEPVGAAYSVALPEPGAEIYFETGDLLLGKGWVDAVGQLPSGGLIELGTRLDEQDIHRCYLRRRNPDGGWGPQDVIEIMPGEECKAVDLVIRDNGTIHALVSWKVNADKWSWWLSDIPQWGTNPLTMASGSAGEDATALAYRDGVLAICGAVPSGFGDLDAFVRVLGLERGPLWRSFDHWQLGDDIQLKHTFDERPRGCALAGDDRLMLAGDVYGYHDAEDPSTRRFVLPFAMTSDEDPKYSIASVGFASQSFATAVDTNDDGQVFVSGYICGDPCNEVVEGQLWIHELGGGEVWNSSLGMFSYPFLAPQALRWSPAGYVLVGHGGLLGDDDTFTVRAFAPLNDEPLWSYTRKDLFVTHWATVLSVGPYAEVCAAGFGANSYPAVACFGG